MNPNWNAIKEAEIRELGMRRSDLDYCWNSGCRLTRRGMCSVVWNSGSRIETKINACKGRKGGHVDRYFCSYKCLSEWAQEMSNHWDGI